MILFPSYRKSYKILSKHLEQFTIDLERLSKNCEFEYFYEQLTSILQKHFSPDLCRIYEFRKGSNGLRLTYTRPECYLSPECVDLLANNMNWGSIGKCFTTKAMYVINNFMELETTNDNIGIDVKIEAEVIIPILYLNEIISVIILDFNHKLSRAEKNIYTILGTLLCLFFRSYYENINGERKINFVLSLQENPDFGFEKALNSLFELINNVFGVRFVSLWLKEKIENDELLILKSFYPLKINDGITSPTNFENQIIEVNENCIEKKVFEDKVPLVFSKYDHHYNNKFLDAHKIDWYISFPITHDNETIGILNYTPFQIYDGSLKETYQALIKELESYVKLFEFIYKSSNYDSIENFLKGYDRIFKILMNFDDERSSWNKLAVSVNLTMKSEACSIFFKNKNELQLECTTGIIGNPDYVDVVYEIGEGLTGYAFQKEEPFIYYEDYSKEFERIHANKFSEVIKSKKSKSILFVPIKNNNEVIGLIRCNNKIPQGYRFDRFTWEDCLKLENISKLIADIYLKKNLIKNITEEREKNIYSLRHEILSPILGIKNHSEWFNFYTKLIPIELWDFDKMNKKFEDIDLNIRLIDVLVNSMDDLDRIMIDNQEFNLFDLIKKCDKFFKSEFKRNGISFKLPYLNIPKNFSGDQLHLMRVFYNLMRNSIKYKDELEAVCYIKILADNGNENKFLLKFEDNGIGIKMGEEYSVFNKFTRGSDASKYFPEGTGLGLAYCKNIVEQHGGRIYFEKLSKPTIIVLEFPK